MAHGDDDGLRRAAPRSRPSRSSCCSSGTRTAPARRPRRWPPSCAAAGVRVELDDRVDTSFGRRATDWELKGVPVRVEVGPRDLADGQGHRRAPRHRREDAPCPLGRGWPPRSTDAARRGPGTTCSPRRPTRRDARTVDVATVDEAVEAGQTGFARIPWALVGDEGEDRAGRRTAITVRCLQRADGGAARQPRTSPTSSPTSARSVLNVACGRHRGAAGRPLVHSRAASIVRVL